MLYRTHHPFFFQFPSATTASFSPLRPISSSPQVQTEMDLALKTSIGREMTQKSSPQMSLDDAWGVNVQNGASCDDFFVDQLLDFSNVGGGGGGEGEGEEEEEEEEKAGFAAVYVSPKQETTFEDDKNSDRTINFYEKDDFVSVPSTEPADDLTSLEWLSHFVEDSNSEYSAPFPAIILAEEPKKENRTEPQKLVITEPCFKTPVPAKARSKRTRTGVRVWPLGSPSFTESSSSSTSSSSSSSPPSPWLIYTNPGINSEPTEPVSFQKLTVKKYKKKQPVETANGGSGGVQPPRRCSHCGVQKTPQWRTGPLGPKTLCNACGVRYKSGRLFPEYRPACSPTFSTELHSNHHRKVLEMRKKKEMSDSLEPGLAPPVVPSFG